MEQNPYDQNNMQLPGAAYGSWIEDDENLLVFCTSDGTHKFIPPGFRFIPTDEELIEDYLKKRVNNEPLLYNLIGEVNFYNKDPSQLIAENKTITENEWYFFTPREKKYPNGSRPNRATPNGYWKPTGTYKDIFQSNGSQRLAGFKRTLDFLEGRHPHGTKTVWKMHEYTLARDDKNNNHNSLNNDSPRGDMTLDDWVLCKLYKSQRGGGDEASTSSGGTQLSTINVAQNPNTFQPTPYQALMRQQATNFQSFYNANSLGYPNGLRPNHALPNRYWMPTGTYQDIPQSHGFRHPAGNTRTLDFYEGNHPRRRRIGWEMPGCALHYNSNNHNFQNNGWHMGDMTVYQMESNAEDRASTSGCEIQSSVVDAALNNEAANSMVEHSNMELRSESTPDQISMWEELGNLQSFPDASLNQRC